MKKLMFAALVAASASAFAIESDVVGYTTTPAPHGLYIMIGSQFTSTLSESGMSIQEFIKGNFTATDYDDDFAWQITSPQVVFWTLNDSQWEYVNYYYQTDAQGTGDSDDGWVDAQAEYAERVIKPGDGFWFIDNSPVDTEGCTVQFAGKVKSDDADVSIVGTGYNMVCNPFPTQLLLNSDSFSMTGISAVDYDDDFEWQITSPKICVWELVDNQWQYTSYYYQTDAQGTGDSDDGWVDAQAEYADASLAPTVGFWFMNPAGGGTLNFTNPIK